MRALTSVTFAGARSGTKNSMFSIPSSKPSSATIRSAVSISSAWRSSDRRVGYSKRSKLLVPAYLTESVIPTGVRRPRRT